MAPSGAQPSKFSIVWVNVTIQNISKKKGYNMSHS